MSIAGFARSTPPLSPRVSVIIPCYNLGEYLPEAIASVRAQSFQDFEIIVVNDGSTNLVTADVLARLPADDVRVIQSSNKGLSAARNLGVRHARGTFVTALDADDRFEPKWLERGVSVFEACPELSFVSHWLRAFGDETWDWTPHRCDLNVLLDYNVLNGAALIRRALIEEVGGFDESMRDGCEDWEFWIRVMSRGYRGAILPEVAYAYRRRPDSMSRKMHQHDRHLQLFKELVAKHSETYVEHFEDLYLRRAWTFASLGRDVAVLADEVQHYLEPAVSERSRELHHANGRLAAERSKALTARALEAAVADLASSRDEARRLEAQALETRRDSDRLERVVDTLQRRVEQLVEERDTAVRAQAAAAAAEARAAMQAAALLRSSSWRLTAPLRRIYEGLRLGSRNTMDR
jgi:glycosyltransferase involved in cell wall biosynthesis